MKELDLLYDSVRIKLGQKQRDPDLDDFMEEYYEITSPHPFDNVTRILGNTAVHISPTSDNEIHIHDILSLLPRSGAGTDAMKELINLSDKYGIPLSGFAKAYHKDKKFITDTDKLLNWYKKLGFTVVNKHEDGYEIRYSKY
jgi:hypothetical protein